MTILWRSGRAVARVMGLALLAAAGMVACNSESSDACFSGTEGCACLSGTCATGLQCNAAQMCVRPGGGPGGPTTLPPVLPVVDGGQPTPVMPPVSTAPPPAPPPPAPVAIDAGNFSLDGGAGGASWTVFIYGHADHSLTGALAADLAEMNAARLSPAVNVIMLADWNSRVRAPSGNGNYPNGAFWYRIRGGGQAAETFAAEPELDFDDPNVLASAIRAAFKAYPAQRYGVILWDHGGGWRGGFGGDTQSGTRKSQPMRVDVTAAAVRSGLAAAGLTGTRRLDFLAFDTCLLGTAEVALEFQDVAQIFIGNAEIDYGAGFDYDGTLTWLAANPAASAHDFARAEAMHWDAEHRDESVNDRLFRSHIALDSEKLAAFGAEVGKLASAAGGQAPAVARAFFETVPSYVKDVSDVSGVGLPPSRDLGAILERLRAIPGLADAAGRVIAAANAAKVAGATGELRAGQLGLGVFAAPIVGLDARLFPIYRSLAATWERASGWGGMLTTLAGQAPRQAPAVTTRLVLPAAPTQADPPRIEFEAGEGGAVAQLWLGELDPANNNRLFIHGVLGAALIGQGTQSARWLGRKTTIDADRPLPVTVLPWQLVVRGNTLTTELRKLPGILVNGNDSADASLLIDDDGTVSAVELQTPDGTAVLPMAIAGEALGTGTVFAPTVLVYDDSKSRFAFETSSLGVPLMKGSTVRVKEEVAGAGGYALFLEVGDVWGNRTTVPRGFRLPAAVAQ